MARSTQTERRKAGWGWVRAMTEDQTIKLVKSLAARPQDGAWKHLNGRPAAELEVIGRLVHQVAVGLDADNQQRHGPGCTAHDKWLYRFGRIRERKLAAMSFDGVE